MWKMREAIGDKFPKHIYHLPKANAAAQAGALDRARASVIAFREDCRSYGECQTMALTQQLVDSTIGTHVGTLLDNLKKYTTNPAAKYGAAVAFAYLPGGFHNTYCYRSAD